MREQTVTHVKKKDLVQVMTGKEKGKSGKILRVDQKHSKVYVEKLGIYKRHTKATGTTPGGIIEHEGPIFGCNVLLFCEKCNRGVRTTRKLVDGGKKARFCRKCKTQLDK